MAINSIGSASTKALGKEFAIEIDQNQTLKNTPGIEDKSLKFADTLDNAIQNVDQLQKAADVQVQDFVTGRSNNIHETMIAVEKADIALKLMVQVRNKIISAYQEIMKMQV